MMLVDNTQNLRILIVIAHPDDESLWFYGGLKKLSLSNDITIFCLTYEKDSVRGRELLAAISDFGIKCHFGNLVDTGFKHCLYGVQKAVTTFIDTHSSEHPFDLIITHPFHGGEKPHPHHLQAFHIMKQECRRRKITFGFFSEKPLPLHPIKNQIFQMKFKNQMQFNIWYLSALVKSLSSQWHLIHEIILFAKEVLGDLFFSQKAFELHLFPVHPKDKLSVLESYKSQLHHLLRYKTIYESVEYLYIETPISFH